MKIIVKIRFKLKFKKIHYDFIIFFNVTMKSHCNGAERGEDRVRAVPGVLEPMARALYAGSERWLFCRRLNQIRHAIIGAKGEETKSS